MFKKSSFYSETLTDNDTSGFFRGKKEGLSERSRYQLKNCSICVSLCNEGNRLF